MENTLTQAENISSASLGKLSLALSKAQAQMQGAKKDSENPFFRSRYADLASVWEACRKPLSDNELSVTQVTDFAANGSLILNTMLMHSSGEKIVSSMPIMLGEETTPQKMGSAITYARRYALSAIVGVAPEDDDGNAASQEPVKSPMKKWAESKPGEKAIKDEVTEFVRKVEMCETISELNRLVENNLALIERAKELPAEWFRRTQDKIATCREAFDMAS